MAILAQIKDDPLFIDPVHVDQAAIDAASDGKVVIVDTGTYRENINFRGKAITVKSADPNNADVVAVTIVKGNLVDSVVTFNNAEGSDSVLSGFTIQNGKAGDGGGIFCQDSSPSITDCTITDNSAFYGGGICCISSSPSIANCTITGNVADDGGGGIYGYSSSPTITNCTLWNDSPDEIQVAESITRITYSDIESGYSGEGNINTDPLFADAGEGDFHLLSNSPCIDNGTDEGVSDTDKDGIPRPFDNGYDMGAYEYYFDIKSDKVQLIEIPITFRII